MNTAAAALTRRPWVTACGLALGLHLLWALWMPSPRTLVAPALQQSPVTSVRYEPVRSWRELQRTQPADARLLRSSALFALPTPLGFSGPELDRDIRHAPDFPGRRAAGLSSPPRALQVAQQPLLPAWHATSAGPRVPPPAPAPVFTGSAPPSGDVLHVRWSDDFAAASRLLSAKEPIWQDAASWELVLVVRYDEKGVLREVFLDPPGPRADRNAAAVRLIRRLAAPPNSAGRSGRVSLRYDGPVSGATS